MDSINEEIRALFAAYREEPIVSIRKIPQSGSIRIYYRVHTDEHSFIAT